jgi:metal-sulfur cluster biosynthetic enzyme
MSKEALPTRTDIVKALQSVIDPELGVSIIDLGLIYGIAIQKDAITIQMTLTSIGCPLFPIIENDIREKVFSASGIQNITIDLVFDPAWNMAMISPSARAELGLT